MQRNSSFGRRDDETEDRKEIYLSILFIFELFSSVRGARKITPPRSKTLAEERGHFSENARLEKERVRVREKTRNVSRSRAGVAFFSSFVVKRVRVENSFFLFERSDRWSLVWPSPSWVGFKWQNVKAQSQEFFSFEFCTSVCSGVFLFWRGGCILF